MCDITHSCLTCALRASLSFRTLLSVYIFATRPTYYSYVWHDSLFPHMCDMTDPCLTRVLKPQSRFTFISHSTWRLGMCDSFHTQLGVRLRMCDNLASTYVWFILHSTWRLVSHSTWRLRMCDVIHSSFICVRYDSFICVIWLIHMCDMTHSCHTHVLRSDEIVT